MHLANVVIPGSFGLDVAFILAGQWGSKLGWGFIPKEILAKALDSAIKDVVKEAVKQGLDAAGQNALDMDAFHANLLKGGQKAGEGGAKAILKQLIKDSLVSRQTQATFATASTSSLQLKVRLEIVKRYADGVAGPAADALGHVMSMYNTGIGVDIERDQSLSSAIDRRLHEHFIVGVSDRGPVRKIRNHRLDQCRRINAPDWRP